jgi:hypothetical protein
VDKWISTFLPAFAGSMITGLIDSLNSILPNEREQNLEEFILIDCAFTYIGFFLF